MSKSLLGLLWRQSRTGLSLAVLAECVGGIATLVLVHSVSLRIAGRPDSLTVAQFGGLLLFACVLQIVAAMTAHQLTWDAVHRLRLSIMDRITCAPLSSIERVGAASIANVLTEVVGGVANALPQTVTLLKHYLFAASCLGYLLWLSPRVSVVVVSVIAAGLLLFRVFRSRALVSARAIHSISVELSCVLHDVSAGSAELRMLGGLRALVSGRYEQIVERLARHSRVLLGWMTCSSSFIYFLLFAVIGVLMFAPLTADGGHSDVIAAFIIVVLFLVGPLQGVITCSHEIGRGAVALARIEELRNALGDTQPSVFTPLPANPDLRIDIEGACYRFKDSSDRDFEIGPVSFSARAGQIVFLVGGNGSGKTTFLKILLSLYEPTTGKIVVNGVPLQAEMRANYRDLFGIVLSGYCLFPSLSGSQYDTSGDDHDMLRLLRLEHVVDERGSTLARSVHMSSGERRRLALLLALREDRSIYVFDELAAEQDPNCKRLIYDVVLPELKSRGKLVFLVTHDTAFDAVADCIVRFERGVPPSVSYQAPLVAARMNA